MSSETITNDPEAAFQLLSGLHDLFHYLKPCDHIQSILSTKAKVTVFSTYRQAVMISCAAMQKVRYKSKKDGSFVPYRKLANLHIESLKCTDCSANDFGQNMICLQCSSVGCFIGKKHAFHHFETNKHSFAVDSSNGLLYCFACNNYVNNPELDQIRMNVFLGAPGDSAIPKEDEIVDSHGKELSSFYLNPSSHGITGLRGFINLGSTCFMSSILQTFIHNPLIKLQFFNNDHHFFNCESNFSYNEGGRIDQDNACITCSIDNIFKNFYGTSSSEGFAMINLLITAWYKKKSLAGFEEQDAHEFLQFILNEFHQDHERVTINEQKNLDKMEADSQFEPKYCKCITHSTFAGELQSSVECLSCHKSTQTFDPMLDISLEISKSKRKDKTVTLYDCLDLYTQKENLDVMYKCQHCGQSSRALKELRIKKVPSVLIIQLKRFEHKTGTDTSRKLDDPVNLPLYLDLEKYVTANMVQPIDINRYETPRQVMALFALVSHIGSVNTGHYKVTIKNDNGEWLHFDDSVITVISEEEVTRSKAYLLFYIKCTI